MQTTNYEEWEKDRIQNAMDKAAQLIDDYKNGYISFCYTTTQSKTVHEYELLKVWHILDSSNIFMDYKISKLKDKCRVQIDLMDP